MDIREIKKRISESSSIDELKRDGLLPPLPRVSDDSNYVFISYSHDDYKCVYCDLFDLYKRGVKYWYDREMTVGESWKKQVYTKIKDPLCSGIIYYLSKNSFTPSMVYETRCSKVDGENAKHKNFISVNISGKNIMELLFACGSKNIEVKQSEVSEMFDLFSDEIKFVTRSEECMDDTHIFDVVTALKERFDITGLVQTENQYTTDELIQLCVTNEGISKMVDLPAAFITAAQVHDESGNVEGKLSCLFKAAELGSSEARYMIAGYYHLGVYGLKKDINTAIHWYGEAAKLGHEYAKCIYERLKNIKPD